jgi:hypothetical protein
VTTGACPHVGPGAHGRLVRTSGVPQKTTFFFSPGCVAALLKHRTVLRREARSWGQCPRTCSCLHDVHDVQGLLVLSESSCLQKRSCHKSARAAWLVSP